MLLFFFNYAHCSVVKIQMVKSSLGAYILNIVIMENAVCDTIGEHCYFQDYSLVNLKLDNDCYSKQYEFNIRAVLT